MLKYTRKHLFYAAEYCDLICYKEWETRKANIGTTGSTGKPNQGFNEHAIIYNFLNNQMIKI